MQGNLRAILSNILIQSLCHSLDHTNCGYLVVMTGISLIKLVYKLNTSREEHVRKNCCQNLANKTHLFVSCTQRQVPLVTSSTKLFSVLCLPHSTNSCLNSGINWAHLTKFAAKFYWLQGRPTLKTFCNFCWTLVRSTVTQVIYTYGSGIYDILLKAI